MAEQYLSPESFPTRSFTSADDAVDYLGEIYYRNTQFLNSALLKFFKGSLPQKRHRTFYPQISVKIDEFSRKHSQLAYGQIDQPGLYSTTVTAPRLFKRYLVDQISLLLDNHHQPVQIGESSIPIPLHFAIEPGSPIEASGHAATDTLRNLFDVPDLAHVNDYIVNGTYEPMPGLPIPLGPFPAQRIDYSLQRLVHYTGTAPQHFQNFVLFTNYQFYIDEFCRFAEKELGKPESRYDSFVAPGNIISTRDSEVFNDDSGAASPQMPAYHLTAGRNRGISLINIGVGPSNAKTITDHVAVLRPHAWLMLGHCAGLRNTQKLGDYVLAHAYVREDHVLDNDIPVWVPIPPLAEIQQALQSAVADVTGLDGIDLKTVMRTGTVASSDNRNWELQDQREPVRRLSQSRAIALDMESATIAANGFRLRVPYGTLLCVSDKPLQGELKLPGMASEFYQTQISQHLEIGVRALNKLADMPAEKLHSRKLRSFFETAFQ